jgi:hypothetical protein
VGGGVVPVPVPVPVPSLLPPPPPPQAYTENIDAMKRLARFFIGALLQILFRAAQARWNNQGRWCGAKLFTENRILSTKISFSTNPAHNPFIRPLHCL